MTTYNVTYYYSMTVEADDECEAEDKADREIERDWSYRTLGDILRGLAVTVDERD